jgi:hypothetical protein
MGERWGKSTSIAGQAAAVCDGPASFAVGCERLQQCQMQLTMAVTAEATGLHGVDCRALLTAVCTQRTMQL